MTRIACNAYWFKYPEAWVLRLKILQDGTNEMSADDRHHLNGIPLGKTRREAIDSIGEMNARRAKLGLPLLANPKLPAGTK